MVIFILLTFMGYCRVSVKPGTKCLGKGVSTALAPLLPVVCSACVRLSLSAPLLRVEIAPLFPTCFTLSVFILSKKHLYF